MFTIKAINIVEEPREGFPIFPLLSPSPCYDVINRLKFCWYHEIKNESGRQSANIDEVKIDSKFWKLLSNDVSYTPNAEDIGRKILVVVNYPDQQMRWAVSENAVCAWSGEWLYDDRVLVTQTQLDGSIFRLVSYNVLADIHANHDTARKIWYPYCPDHALNINYRKQLILKEVLGYNADIVCLQEVDDFVFYNYLEPSLNIGGYIGFFGSKSDLKEGSAIFYKPKRWKLIKKKHIAIKDSIVDEQINGNLHKKILRTPELEKSVMDAGTCLLLCTLQSNEEPSKYIIVCDVHFIWQPDAHNLHLIQSSVALNETKYMHDELCLSNPNLTCARIICGDFNSRSHSGAIELMTSGKVPSNHADFYSKGKSQYVENMDLSHDTKYKSACGFPTFTNYVSTFIECIDYVMYDPKHLGVKRVIPLPANERIRKHSALPSVACPSDHIAQVVELQLL